MTLTTVTFAAGSQLQTIGREAFNRCILTSITIPASVTSIGDSAFGENSSLETVTFAAGSQLQTIGRWAFGGCIFTSITIPASVTSIADNAFATCTDLISVIFGGSGVTIGDNVFPQRHPYGLSTSGNNLKDAYTSGGAGTYTREVNGSTWAKQ